ncbi:FAD-dependent monooxygenase [Actinophytocola xanthii]|uniref:FAD-dependent oxidoreductase n=1 Tax=Actinophytocola xanthii TaxID=1912961 RepID=A0A1Q8CQH8_9PSEU|nr:FAD-dependent monooxygenase [Actinophytocola xanthii]OLF16614.1 FAD-dependent oxidoreductase [Actinophytocola xanthii]
MKVLVSGASVTGPTLAYWLRRNGAEVTVVEKAPAMRLGGYPIDVRGTALGVLERMGVLERVRAAHIHTHTLRFVDARGRSVGSLRPEALTGGGDGRDLEVPRGHLATILHEAVRDDVEFVFGDSIAELNQHDDRVEVSFAGGARREFDLVLGADGLHSNTRRLAFGPEERYSRYLGYCFAGFTLPNDLGLAHEGVNGAAPGRMGVLYAPGCTDTLHGFLMLARPEPPLAELDDVAAQRELMARAFDGDGWEIPRLLEAMRTADDVFFDLASQIHMPSWSRGRVALAGDAAHAPSFFSGQGTSTALVGAYVLAGELARAGSFAAGFASYERTMRPFVRVNQALADTGGSMLAPATASGLWLRNRLLRVAPLLVRTGLVGRSARRATTALDLPSYAA